MDHAELVFVSGHLCPSCQRALRQAGSGYWVEGPAQDDLLAAPEPPSDFDRALRQAGSGHWVEGPADFPPAAVPPKRDTDYGELLPDRAAPQTRITEYGQDEPSPRADHLR